MVSLATSRSCTAVEPVDFSVVLVSEVAAVTFRADDCLSIISIGLGCSRVFLFYFIYCFVWECDSGSCFGPSVYKRWRFIFFFFLSHPSSSERSCILGTPTCGSSHRHPGTNTIHTSTPPLPCDGVLITTVTFRF